MGVSGGAICADCLQESGQKETDSPSLKCNGKVFTIVVDALLVLILEGNTYCAIKTSNCL